MKNIFFYIAGALTMIWGIAHLFPTRNVARDFGDISQDNKHIITMEWIIEGAALNFLPFKLCPVIFTVSAALILTGIFLR